eukprot:CAMPEP_0204273692 /NCGR_PEP_ID=MMETSP0468-20130131/24108_1 /ASSEMBLY_ACC=CAM_ASM_000383 /TAXON_ID=2969 /ORGANISM="Oxyrrhis marina" /LENGTH=148 /DNA_ID=CAMNT_0051249791 /DNA_START=67 /DNA_END=511 /DNA_ORIENTATION=-
MTGGGGANARQTALERHATAHGASARARGAGPPLARARPPVRWAWPRWNDAVTSARRTARAGTAGPPGRRPRAAPGGAEGRHGPGGRGGVGRRAPWSAPWANRPAAEARGAAVVAGGAAGGAGVFVVRLWGSALGFTLHGHALACEAW